MRLGPVVHGGLLVVALTFSYQTSTRKEDLHPKRGTHSVWKLDSVSALVLETETKLIRLERRNDEHGPYLWGSVARSRTVKKPAAHVGPALSDAGPEDGGDAGSTGVLALPETETTVTTREFPVGAAGEELMEQYRSLMALRKIGPVETDGLEYYNLHDKTHMLTAIREGQGERSLLLASEKIYGGTDRYVLDVEEGIGYVLSGKLIQPLNSAESSLSIKSVHSYEDALVTSIGITTPAGDKILVKNTTKDEGGQHVVWEYESAPGTADAALGSFIERVKKLKPTRYDGALDSSSLVHIATLRYRDESKTALGYLELYRLPVSAQESPKKAGATQQTQYYIKTERTRVLGKVGRLDADRVDQDLVELFGIAPAATPTPTPTPTPAPAPTP